MTGAVESPISLCVADDRDLSASLATTLAPSRASTCRMLVEIIGSIGLPGAAACLSVPMWLVSRWLAVQAPLRARDKKAIWLIHSLIFHPEHLSSLFHVATFARFWCGPYSDSVPLKPRKTKLCQKCAK